MKIILEYFIYPAKHYTPVVIIIVQTILGLFFYHEKQNVPTSSRHLRLRYKNYALWNLKIVLFKGLTNAEEVAYFSSLWATSLWGVVSSEGFWGFFVASFILYEVNCLKQQLFFFSFRYSRVVCTTKSKFTLKLNPDFSRCAMLLNAYRYLLEILVLLWT